MEMQGIVYDKEIIFVIYIRNDSMYTQALHEVLYI